MTEHTPGPWRIEPRRGGHGKIWDYIIWKEGHLPYIGVVFYQGSTLTPEGEAESFQNARLIGAAPELLAACKQAKDFLEMVGYCGGGAAPGAILDRAIAKAEGRDNP